MTSSRPWTVSIGKQRPQTWFWKSIFTSAPLWWNVSVHKKNKISTHAVYRFNFMLPFCQKKPQKQGFAKQKTWSLCVQLSSVQGVTSVFPLIVQDGCFCPDVQVIALRLAAELMHLSAGQSDLLGVTSKDTHTHTIVTIHARTDQGIEIYSLLEGCSCGPNRSTAGLLVHFLGPFNSVPSGTVLQRF